MALLSLLFQARQRPKPSVMPLTDYDAAVAEFFRDDTNRRLEDRLTSLGLLGKRIRVHVAGVEETAREYDDRHASDG